MTTVGVRQPDISRGGVKWDGVKPIPLLITLAVGLIIWIVPPPAGVEIAAWHLFAVFVATIVGIIVAPLPMGAVAMLGIAAAVLSGALGTGGTAIGTGLSGFANTTIWLIVLAFFVARGFIKTGLGTRIAYLFIRLLGKKTLGLSYGLIATDLVLAPVIPSNTARAGGVVFPVLLGINKIYESNPDDGTARKIGAFLTKSAFQGTVITSAMFLTAMAANPLAVELAAENANVTVTWGGWAIAALVPGLLSLLVVPWLLYKLYPPEVKETPAATEMAKEKLAEMGKLSRDEIFMLIAFVGLLGLWAIGSMLGVNATTAALIGLVFLLLVGVLTWEDVKAERGAWDTLVWFAALVMMATQLNTLGLIPWFGDTMANAVGSMGWVAAFLLLAIVYFYSHYLFASCTAHVSAMYAAFLVVSIAVGTPPLLAALVLAFFSNLFSGMTHYGTGPAPVLFGSGYVDIGTWWKLGGLISVVNIVIWLVVGGLWWKVLGLW